jgi:hypothetical protein
MFGNCQIVKELVSSPANSRKADYMPFVLPARKKTYNRLFILLNLNG